VTAAMTKKLDENDVEQAALEYLREFGWRTAARRGRLAGRRGRAARAL